MRAWQIAVFMFGALMLSVSGVQAQTAGATTPPAAAAAPAQKSASAAQQVLTPEQIEELQSMVSRMQSAMQDMVNSARSTAGRLASGSQTVVLSTNEIAAIAIGAAGGGHSDRSAWRWRLGDNRRCRRRRCCGALVRYGPANGADDGNKLISVVISRCCSR